MNKHNNAANRVYKYKRLFKIPMFPFLIAVLIALGTGTHAGTLKCAFGAVLRTAALARGRSEAPGHKSERPRKVREAPLLLAPCSLPLSPRPLLSHFLVAPSQGTASMNWVADAASTSSAATATTAMKQVCTLRRLRNFVVFIFLRRAGGG